MGILKNIINDNQFNVEELSAFKDKLFFEGAKRRVNLEQFAVLLFLSTAALTKDKLPLLIKQVTVDVLGNLTEYDEIQGVFAAVAPLH